MTDDPEAQDGPLIILLIKYPRRGEVKSRLARQIGEDLAAAIYRNFVLDMLSTMERSGLRGAVSFHPPGALCSLREWLGPSLRCYPQRGADHPERLKNTFVDAFSRGEGRVLVLASDLPDLTSEVIKEAGEALERNDAVLGPSTDGGYYLIGFRRETFRNEAFQGIAWSTERAFDDTLSRLNGLTVHLLPTWPDVDTAGDLEELIVSDRNPDFPRSRTMALLRESGLAGR